MNRHPSSPLRRRTTRGFTLVEILIAMAIMGFAVAGTVTLLTQALRTYYYDSGRLRVNRDIRTFTQDMDTDAAYSNYFLIYPNFSTRSSGSPVVDAYVADGQSGDFLLLVTIFACTTDGVGPNGSASGFYAGHNYVTKLVGYYRDATTTTTGPVRRFSVNVPTSGTHYPADMTDTSYYTNPGPPMATLLNAVEPTSNQSTNPVVVQIAEGLAAGSSTSGLFYDFQDKSIMVRGQIIETDNGTINDTNRKAVNTYNFTVSPRG
ncbi:MAG TPA: prepilin-type N-terminal cleavage/methylation domain-containing protein [Candidatus Didemnitutus sp.]|nr:prepilin-type N-terminal cleavage/methylation domain-containing protein [Candidatus Didemnitutus sp.]